MTRDQNSGPLSVNGLARSIVLLDEGIKEKRYSRRDLWALMAIFSISFFVIGIVSLDWMRTIALIIGVFCIIGYNGYKK